MRDRCALGTKPCGRGILGWVNDRAAYSVPHLRGSTWRDSCRKRHVAHVINMMDYNKTDGDIALWDKTNVQEAGVHGAKVELVSQAVISNIRTCVGNSM